VTDATEAMPSTGWRALPRWLRIGIVVLITVTVVLATLVIVRVITRVPPIPTGVTAVGDLRPGSCLAESGDLDEYTVVACDEPHPQQVFAEADLDLDDNVYSSTASALQLFGDALCGRYLEYRLFLAADLDRNEYEVAAIDVPDPDTYAGGDTVALCVITSEAGDDLTGDLYRPMP
jgi:hypothetical protein